MHSLKSDNLASGCSTGLIEENFNKVCHGLGKPDKCYRMKLDPQSSSSRTSPKKISSHVTGEIVDEIP